MELLEDATQLLDTVCCYFFMALLLKSSIFKKIVGEGITPCLLALVYLDRSMFLF